MSIPLRARLARHLLTGALIATLAAGGLAGAAAAADDDTLVIGAAVFPDTLSTGVSSFAALSLATQTMDALVSRSDDGSLAPGLAESWKAVDPTTWRFALRDGVTWHDGEPFTAEDVKATLDYVLSPDSVYGTKRRVSQISGVTVVDPHTVEITTKNPFPTLLRGLADIPIEAKHRFEQAGRDGMARLPIGTGPFKFVEWVPGDRYVLEANEAYWGGTPKVGKVIIRQIPEGSTRVASLLAGETQIIEEVPVDLIPQIEQTAGVGICSVESSVGLALTFDTREPPFDDVRVRRAVDHAIDKKLILDQMLLGQGTLLKSQILTSNTFGHNPAIEPRAYDPEKAKALLAEAGHADGFPTSITTRSGKYLSDVDIANVVAGMLQQVGIASGVEIVEGGVFSKMVKARDMGPIHMVGWYSLGDADFATVWYTDASGRAYWKNDEFETLFVAARSTVDEAERLKAYHRMMELMHEEVPSVFLFGLPSIYGCSDRLTGWGAPSDKVLRLSTAGLED